MTNLRRTLVGLGVVALAAVGCGAVPDVLVARTDVVELSGQRQSEVMVLANDLTGPGAEVSELGSFDRSAIEATMDTDRVLVRAVSANPGDEFVVDYQISDGDQSDWGSLVVRIADGAADEDEEELEEDDEEENEEENEEIDPAAVAITVEPRLLDFGQVEVGESPLVEAITVVNNDSVTVETEVSTVSRPFDLTAFGCDRIAPGDQCRIEYLAETSAIGSFKDTIEVTASAPNRVDVGFDVDLVAVVSEKPKVAAIVVKPGVVQLDYDTTAAKVSLGNTGDVMLVDVLLPASEPAVEVDNGDCGGGLVAAYIDPLSPGESCTFQVFLSKAARADEIVTSVELMVSGGGISETLTVDIDATAPGIPRIDLDRNSVGFYLGNEEKVTITNTGEVPLTGLSIGSYQVAEHDKGSVEIQSTSCPQTLDVKESCTVALVFVPDGNFGYSSGTVAVNYGQARSVLPVTWTTLG